MKTLAALTLGLAVIGAVSPVMARDGDQQRLAQCQSELHKIYGEDASIRLKSLSHKRGGTYMRLKTVPAQGESLVLTCQVDKEGTIYLLDSDGVALVVPTDDTAGKVSLTN
ncbi:MAG: hypothetical protein V7700_06825 [Halioglobus sp.]